MNSRHYLDDQDLPAAGFGSHNHPTFSPHSLRSALESDSARYTLAVLIGIYFLYTVLGLLGFPFLRMATSLLGYTDEQTSEMQASGGKVLSSVFGLNNGLLGKGVRGVTGALSKRHGSNSPAGLGNWDNSCYQNSVIQGLASLPSLRRYLENTTAENDHLDAESTNGALLEMINKLHNPEHQGQHFWIRGTLKSMSTWQQQDAQEYYSKILDALDKEAQKASKSKTRSTASWLSTVKNLGTSLTTREEELELSSETEKPQDTAQPAKPEDSEKSEESEESPTPPEQSEITPNPLDGLLAQRVGCINCGYTEGLSMIPFNCITVPLGRAHHFDVRECLDEYTKLEYIEGVECAKCTLLKMKDTLAKLAVTPDSPFAGRLKAVEEALQEGELEDKTLKALGIAKKNYIQTTKSRQAVISRSPKALVLHVNRSIFDEMTGAQLKNSATVSYPPILDLGNWCLGSRPSESQKPDDEVEERWPKDPKVSMIATDSDPVTTSPFQYRLRATVTHFGSHGNGHYVCFRQQPPSAAPTPDSESPDVEEAGKSQNKRETWWRFSDENVREVSEESALNQGGVFMLFYERIDPEDEPSLEAESIPTAVSLAPKEVAPLPVESTETDLTSLDLESAVSVALPGSDTESGSPSPMSSPKIIPAVATTEIASLPLADQDAEEAHPTVTEAPTTPETVHEDTEMSEADSTNYDSDNAPSTLMTSDDESHGEFEADFNIPQVPTLGPRTMRTAGNALGPGKRGQQSLPMVSAL